MILHPLDRLLDVGFDDPIIAWDADDVPWIVVGELRADGTTHGRQRFSVEDVASVLARWEELGDLAVEVISGREIPRTHRHLFLRGRDGHGRRVVLVTLGEILIETQRLQHGEKMLRDALHHTAQGRAPFPRAAPPSVSAD